LTFRHIFENVSLVAWPAPGLAAGFRSTLASDRVRAEVMQISQFQPVLNRVGSIAAAALIPITIAWAVLLVYPSAPSADAHPVERLHYISTHDNWQVASLIVAVVMAILYVPLWLALGAAIARQRQTLGLAAVVLGVLYGPVVIVGYWTQLTTLRGLDSLRQRNVDAAIAMADAFSFSGNFWTGSYGIVIVGFVIWGLAMAAVSVGLAMLPASSARATGAMFGLAGLLAIVGAIGFASGVSVLEHGLLLSGVISTPALASAAIMLHQREPREISQATAEPVLQ
jgi:hypothetical protein